MIGFAPRSKLPSKRVSLAAMPPLRDALRMRGPETDWADRRGWLSMSELLRIPQQLGKMSCFSIFSNFAESQKELKTAFEIPCPFFIFPVLPFRQEGGSRPEPWFSVAKRGKAYAEEERQKGKEPERQKGI